jgi:hypothetical protein
MSDAAMSEQAAATTATTATVDPLILEARKSQAWRDFHAGKTIIPAAKPGGTFTQATAATIAARPKAKISSTFKKAGQ